MLLLPWTELFNVCCTPTLRHCRRPMGSHFGSSGAPDAAETGLADPSDDWPAASPRDATAVTPREPK